MHGSCSCRLLHQRARLKQVSFSSFTISHICCFGCYKPALPCLKMSQDVFCNTYHGDISLNWWRSQLMDSWLQQIPGRITHVTKELGLICLSFQLLPWKILDLEILTALWKCLGQGKGLCCQCMFQLIKHILFSKAFNGLVQIIHICF